MTLKDLVDRSFLCQLRERAMEMCSTPSLNPQWRRAYEDLAAAADKLDAMEARCSVLESTSGRPLEIGTEAGLAEPPATDDFMMKL